MKEAKKQYYNTEILNCLIDGDIVSTQQIADAVGMSEKSIRNKIFDINEYLQENDMGIIQKKPRVGMWLECTEEQKQKLQSVLMNRNTVVVKDDDNDRVMELLKIFFKLRPWETITTQRLTEELYLSAPTVLKIIRECEKWLAPYKVKIANEKNRGYRLDCNENEYRVAMKDFIMSDFDNEKITIEHIFPQKPGKAWKENYSDSELEQMISFKDTISNLTLTGSNSNLSNKSFLEKRDDEVHGYRNSKLYMNKYLGKLDEWNLLSMEARFESLYEDIVKIWQRPEDKVTDDMEKITFVLKGSITSGTGRLLSNEKFEILKGTSIVLEVKSENPTTFKRNKNLINDLEKLGYNAHVYKGTLNVFIDEDPVLYAYVNKKEICTDAPGYEEMLSIEERDELVNTVIKHFI